MKPSLHELEEKVLAAIDEDALVEFHRGLVRIPSVNPPGDTRAAIGYVAAPLKEAGFAIETMADEIEPDMVSLIARLGNADGKRLLLNAHVDVVPTGEREAWTRDPFSAAVEDGKIYGRGAGDDKASVAAQVIASLAVAKAGIPLAGELIVTEVADEEVGGEHGAVLVANADLKPDWVIVGEQTLNRVCVGEKGGAGVIVTTFGKTAHGALPWEGVNAIEAMAEVIVALRRELWSKISERTHWAFHPSSIAVTMIEGGVKRNVIPDKCQINIDRRIVPGEKPGDCAAEIRAIAEQAVSMIPGATVTVELAEGLGGEASEAPVDSPLVQSMIGANRRLGFNEEPTGFSMATDGRHFARLGTPTIIYGPGDPALAHKPNEWIGIDEMVDAAKAYAVAIVRLIGDYEEQQA